MIFTFLCSVFLLLLMTVLMSVMDDPEPDLNNPVLGCLVVIWLGSGLLAVVSGFWLMTAFL